MCPPRVSVGSSQWSASGRPVIAAVLERAAHQPGVATGRPSSVNAAAPASASSAISVSCAPAWPFVIAAEEPDRDLRLRARASRQRAAGRRPSRRPARCSASRGSRSSRPRRRRRCREAIVSSSSRPGRAQVDVRVDERGREHEPGAVDDAVPVRVERRAELRRSRRRRSGRRAARRRPRRVEHARAADDEVVAGASLPTSITRPLDRGGVSTPTGPSVSRS